MSPLHHRWIALGIAGGVWLAALGTGAGLFYVLDRPLDARSDAVRIAPRTPESGTLGEAPALAFGELTTGRAADLVA